jgi:hypothetical protein
MHELLSPIKSDLIGIPKPKIEISETVGRVVSEKFRVDIVQADASEVDVGDINFSAEYDVEKDSMDRPCITVFMVYNPLDDILIFDEELFENMSKRLCDSIAHEQIHQRQYRNRFWEDPYDVDIDNPIEYLSNKDEIDAYSYNIANELLDYADIQKVLTLLQEPSKIRIEHSVNLYAYLMIFENANHPVIKRLIKKIVKVLPEVKNQR